MPMFLRNACWGLLASLMLAASASALEPTPSTATPSTLNSAQNTTLAMVKAQLTDPSRSVQTKSEAAMLLLTQTYPQAIAAARDFLSDEANRPAQIAVAEAIAQSGQTHADFVKPLLGMLAANDPASRTAAAHALAAFKDASVVDAFLAALKDPLTGRETRLVIVQSMRRMLDRRVIDVLVVMLEDPDEAMRTAAGKSLTSLTGMREFGHNPARWQEWWTAYRDKPRTAWVCDLADNLVTVNCDLARENDEIRKRLAAAMNDVYAVSSPAARDLLLVEMLKDPLPEIRLAGAKLTGQRLAASQQPLPEPLRVQIRSAVTDPDPAVRGSASVLLASIADAKTIKLLLDRLHDEQSPESREGIYQALGLLRDADVTEQLIRGISEQDKKVASAAAGSLARLAEKGALSDDRRDAAGDALRKRYALLTDGSESTSLREALLAAMVNLKDRRLSELMTLALKDPAPAIRLNAIRGLQNLAMPELVDTIANMTSDPDRGVRLGALTAVGTLSGTDQIERVLVRTDSRVETDPAVREQAWGVVMSMLNKLDTARLSSLADRLAERPDAAGYLVSVLKLWAERIPEDHPDQWLPVRQRLGEGLMAASRPAEAAGELAKVHAGLVKSGDAKVGDIYLKLINAMLAADDAAVAAKIAETQDQAQFECALDALTHRVDVLQGKKDWDNLVNLCGAANTRIGARMTPAQRSKLANALEEARKQQRLADEQRVSALVPKLTGADEPTRQAAAKDLTAMNQRAVAPLVSELRNVVKADNPDPAAEKSVLDLVVALCPQLKGYDLAQPASDRLKVIDAWLRQLGM